MEQRLKMEIIESGSYFSNLRIGKPYEFDFMIDITSTFFYEQKSQSDGYTVKREKVDSDGSCEPAGYFYQVFPKENESDV